MERHGFRLSSALAVFALIVGLVIFPARADESSGEDVSCPAAKKYREYLKDLEGVPTRHGLDYSCLIEQSAIEGEASSYQLVDTRTDTSLDIAAPKAWRLTVRDLLNRKAAKNKSLLLLGEGFSRYAAARDCAALKRAGYSDVKVLNGGVAAWRKHNGKRYLNTSSGLLPVSPRALIHESFNTKVILVTSSTRKAGKLESMGFEHVRRVGPDQQDAFYRILADESGGGFYPVVMADRNDPLLSNMKSNADNLYAVKGGVEAIATQLAKKHWSNTKRNSVPRRYLCGRS